MVCENIQSFPLEGYEGNYDDLVLDGLSGNITKIPKSALPGISASSIRIVSFKELTQIESGFLSFEDQTKTLTLAGNDKLRDFPWNDLRNFNSLEFLEVITCGFETIPSDIDWPERIERIQLNSLFELKVIESNAFSKAKNLKYLDIQNSGADLVVKTNGFKTTSKQMKYISQYSHSTKKVKLEADAFGMESGGELWNSIAVPSDDFAEDVFRKMLNNAAESGFTSK